MRTIPSLAGAVLLFLAGTTAVPADPLSCSLKTTKGTYAVRCSGFLTPGPSAPSLPFTVLGVVTGNADGYFQGAATNMVAGNQSEQTVAGQADTKPDCTGAITYNKGAQDELNVKYVVLSNGDEIRGLVTNPGANVSCTLTRMQ